MVAGLHRQRWVRLAPRAAESVTDPLARDVIAGWLTEGRPAVIARRLDMTAADGQLQIGIPLPKRLDRARIALSVSVSDVEAVFNPPTLKEAAEASPPSWRSTIAAIDRLSARHGVTIHVFGSLAWQVATGEAYLRERSDLDLLISPAGADGTEQFLSELAAMQPSPITIDGECWRHDGAGAQWRELLDNSARLIVKTNEGLSIMTKAAFFSESALDH